MGLFTLSFPFSDVEMLETIWGECFLVHVFFSLSLYLKTKYPVKISVKFSLDAHCTYSEKVKKLNYLN